MVAALAPARCGALCAQLGGPGAAIITAEAARLASRARIERLRALAHVLAEDSPPAQVVAAELELHPLLRRLAAEARRSSR